MKFINLYIKKQILFPFLLAALFFTFFYFCPIRFLTGVPCPGCGMTRAIYSLFQFNISQAFYYHPLFFVSPAFIYIAYGKKPLLGNKKKETFFYISLIILFFGVYIFRVFITHSKGISINFHEGFLYHFFTKIQNLSL